MLRQLLSVLVCVSVVMISTVAEPVAPVALRPPAAGGDAIPRSDVVQTRISGTICLTGCTKQVRPSSSFTSVIKCKLLSLRGEPAENTALYELDHIVPLTLGGHPRAFENLRLQPWDEAKQKDRLEAKLGCLVCTGQVGLAEAQRAIATDWQAAYHVYARVKCPREKREERAEAAQ